ncbi:MAG: hypothetical protein SNJ82_13710 [Gemmataceae bacterium]
MSRGWFTLGLALLAATMPLRLEAEQADTPASPDAPVSPAELVERLNHIGREGQGNPEAAAAWKQLTQAGPEALLPILRGFDPERAKVAANWLRPAFDSLAEKALAAKKLPTKELTAFLEDTTNNPAARRLAYETLLKADAKTAEKYLPGMLNDPSPELRRDAVALLIGNAEKLLKAEENDSAKFVYEKALKGACDPDQVETIAVALSKLGVRVDLQKHLGVVSQWYLAAPFEHQNGSGWNVAYPPEKGVDLKATYKGKDNIEVKWLPVGTKDAQGLVDINKAIKQYKGAICYAYAEVDSPGDQEIQFRAGCINGLKIFVNAEQIFAKEEYHHGMSIDQYIVKGKLKKGTNTILLKVAQNEQKEPWAQRWTFQLRLTDSVGAAIPFSQKEAK